MKRIIIFAVAILAFSSCVKRHTYQCTTINDNGYYKPTVSVTTHENWTEDDKQNYVQANNRTWKNGGALASIRTSCHIK